MRLLHTGVDIVQRRSQRFDGVDVDDLVSVAACAQQIIDAAIDVRALATVEAQALNDDRPNLTRFAAAQGVAPSGLRRRYSQNLASILRNVADGGQLDEHGLLAELRSFDAHTFQQAMETPAANSAVGNPRTPSAPERPGLRSVLSDPLIVVSKRVDESERKRITNAYALLGRIHETLRGSLTDAVAVESWVSAGGSGVGLHWNQSLRIDQVLPILLPLERNGVPVGGIPELALDNAQSDEASLSWSSGQRKLSLRLMRSS